MSGKATAEAGDRDGAADELSASRRRAATAEEATGGPASASGGDAAPVSFLRRYRLPLVLAVVALCLYVGSIVYILLGRGQIA